MAHGAAGTAQVRVLISYALYAAPGRVRDLWLSWLNKELLHGWDFGHERRGGLPVCTMRPRDAHFMLVTAGVQAPQ